MRSKCRLQEACAELLSRGGSVEQTAAREAYQAERRKRFVFTRLAKASKTALPPTEENGSGKARLRVQAVRRARAPCGEATL